MKHLDKLHADRFYTKLVTEGHLIQEKVEGTDNDGKFHEYWGFDDAENEAGWEGVTLNDYGNALYFMDGTVYEAVVYLPNNEGSGINEYESEDIEQLIKDLIKEIGDIDEFYEKEPWEIGRAHV